MRGLDDILAVIDARRREFFVLRAHPLGPDDVAVVSGPEIAARADLHAGPETAIVTPNPDLCPELDGAVDTARAAGALGARMTGGGFGGSAIALVPAGLVGRVERAVEEAYAEHGWDPPRFIPAVAAEAGRRVR